MLYLRIEAYECLGQTRWNAVVKDIDAEEDSRLVALIGGVGPDGQTTEVADQLAEAGATALRTVVESLRETQQGE